MSTPGEPADARPAPNQALPARVSCPFCGGNRTEQFSAFGSAVSTAQYYCTPCRTVFEYMKWAPQVEPRDDTPPAGHDDA